MGHYRLNLFNQRTSINELILYRSFRHWVDKQQNGSKNLIFVFKVHKLVATKVFWHETTHI